METAMAGAKGLVRWIQVHVVRFADCRRGRWSKLCVSSPLSKKRSTPQRDSKIESAWLLEDMLGAVEALPSNRPS